MSFASANTLLPTNTLDERGGPAIVRSLLVDAPTIAQGLNQRASRSWGATPEKMAFLQRNDTVHKHSERFERIFKECAPSSGDGAPGGRKKRRAFMVATSYNRPDALGWPPLPGPPEDLKWWGRFCPTRGFLFDYVSDELTDPSSRPTRDVTLGYLSHLAQCTEAGDEIVLIFSGHGDNSAYIPIGCPLDHRGDAIYPADFRASFIDLLPSRVTVLVIWDTCNAPNPFALPWRLDLREDQITFEPTGFPQDDTGRSVLLISASSETTTEVELNGEPVKVQCGPLCWATFSFVFCHLHKTVEAGGILKRLVGHIRKSFEEKPKVKPQFLCSAGGPNVPPAQLELLNSLLSAYHAHAAEHE